MKTIKLLPLFLSFFALLVIGCSEDNTTNSGSDSELIPQQIVASESLNLNENIEILKSANSETALQSFLTAGVNEPVISDTIRNSIITLILNSGNNANDYVFRGISYSETLKNLFDVKKGIYTYNASLKIWEKEASESEIRFNFPADYNNTTNDVSLAITLSSDPEFHSNNNLYNGLISVNITLSDPLQTLLEFVFNGAYNNGILNSSNASLNFAEGYNLTTKTNSDGTFEHLFRKGDSNLYICRIDNSSNTSNISIGGITLSGKITIENLFTQLNSAYPNESDRHTEESAQAVTNIMNSNIDLSVVYNSKNIATCQFYAKPIYTDYYQSTMKLVFNDGTSVDDFLFDNGFEALLIKLHNLTNPSNP